MSWGLDPGLTLAGEKKKIKCFWQSMWSQAFFILCWLQEENIISIKVFAALKKLNINVHMP